MRKCPRLGCFQNVHISFKDLGHSIQRIIHIGLCWQCSANHFHIPPILFSSLAVYRLFLVLYSSRSKALLTGERRFVKKMVDKNVVLSPAEEKIKIIKWRVKEGHSVTNLQVILLYEECGSESKEAKKLKSNSCGVVKKCLFADGAVVEKGSVIRASRFFQLIDFSLAVLVLRSWSYRHASTRL